MHNRTTAHASAIAAGVLLALFAALTVSLVFVDRQPIAGDGSLVGLATFNLDARTILGQSNLMEKLSNLLLIVPAVGALMIAIVGCKQLIRSRSRSGVDRDLWLLLGIYGAMLVLYVLFNCISPNNRPILEDGACEPSFPSSHTLLAVTMCGTAMTHPPRRFAHRGPCHLRRWHGGHRRRARHGGRSLDHRHPWRHPTWRHLGGSIPRDSVRRLRQSLTRKACKTLTANRRDNPAAFPFVCALLLIPKPVCTRKPSVSRARETEGFFTMATRAFRASYQHISSSGARKRRSMRLP